PAMIEFIHFGHVHTDSSEKFAQESKVKDDQPLAAKRAEVGRGVRFRAALQREALLIGGYVAQTHAALQDWKSSPGGLGQALEAAANLMSAFGGGGGGGPSGPDPSDLNDYAEAVEKAVDPIAASPAEYPKVHAAGIALHQARADYAAYRDGLV